MEQTSLRRIADDARILIVLTGALGDVVRGLAVASAIKQQSPDCTLHWLIDKRWKGIVGLCSSIDALIVFDRKAGLSGWMKFADILRRGRYDVVLDMQRIFKSGLFSWLTKAPLRIGFHKNNAKEGNYLFNNCFIAKQDPNENKLRHYLMFLPEIGLVVPEKPDFGLLRTVPNLKLPEGFVAKKFVVVVLGSSWESKDWPLAGYLELCRIWQERRQEPLVLVGTVSDQVAARKITEQIPSIINLCGSTSLEELLAVLFHAKAAIGPDSGPGHLAAAIGIPYISLFGPTPPERVGPFSMDDLVVRAHVGCMPCYQRKCPGLDKVCMRLISAEAVYAKLVYGINKKEVVHGR